MVVPRLWMSATAYCVWLIPQCEAVGGVVIEAGVVAGYVIAWAMRKARRVGGRLDAEVDAVMDAGLDQLHEVVAARLGAHPVLVEVTEEAEQVGQVSELTRQQVELAVATAASEDELFGRAVMELVARLQKAEHTSGLVAAQGATVVTGDAHAEARDGGFAFGQVTGGVHIGREPADPREPGRSGH